MAGELTMPRIGWRSARTFVLAVASAVASAVACSDATSPRTLELTSAQAAAIVDGAGQLAVGRSELSWLADSLELVIHSGATVKPITIRIDGKDETYYAAGLSRGIISNGTQTSFATFHLLAFDDVSAPKKFVVVNGFKQSNTTTPPTTVSGSFGSAIAGHYFELGTTAVVEWIAIAGTATFTAGPQGAPCAGFTPANGVSCYASSFTTSFEIVSSLAPSPLVPPKTASLASVEIPGVLLHIESSL
jgi:hypothetical protein